MYDNCALIGISVPISCSILVFTPSTTSFIDECNLEVRSCRPYRN